jgi:hypothetical protein
LLEHLATIQTKTKSKLAIPTTANSPTEDAHHTTPAKLELEPRTHTSDRTKIETTGQQQQRKERKNEKNTPPAKNTAPTDISKSENTPLIFTLPLTAPASQDTNSFAADTDGIEWKENQAPSTNHNRAQYTNHYLHNLLLEHHATIQTKPNQSSPYQQLQTRRRKRPSHDTSKMCT